MGKVLTVSNWWEEDKPHVVTGVPENKIIRALFEGLAVKNPYTLEPEPGVAERWDISEDGTVVTFHINPQTRWSNGDPMTAHDYVWSWRRALDPAMGNLYAYMLYPVKNAEAYATGKITDFSEVGVEAIDDLTLQVSLNEPTPYFIQLMDHYSTFAVHRATIEKFGKPTDRFTRWTRVENMVNNGAFNLSEWKLNRHISMLKSDTYWDRDNVKLNGVVVGKVVDIFVDSTDVRKIIVKFSVRQGTPIKEDMVANLSGGISISRDGLK